MRWAIPIPQFVDRGGAFDEPAFRRFLARAETLGFESAWTMEQVLGAAGLLGAIETMTYAAACTERLRLGCVVFVAPLHQPVHLAKSISSLDQLSGGRLEVGIGFGGAVRPFRAFEVDPADGLVARFNEQIHVLKALWTEPEVTFEGRFWQLQNAPMEPKPIQKPHPPLWFGASAPAALRRAVRYGNGFFGAGSSTTTAFAEQVGVVRRELEAQGRDPGSFPVAKRIYIAVDEDNARARQRLATVFAGIYGTAAAEPLLDVTVSGPPDACVKGVQDVADAGARLTLLNPVFDQAEQMERLADEVMPFVS